MYLSVYQLTMSSSLIFVICLSWTSQNQTRQINQNVNINVKIKFQEIRAQSPSDGRKFYPPLKSDGNNLAQKARTGGA